MSVTATARRMAGVGVIDAVSAGHERASGSRAACSGWGGGTRRLRHGARTAKWRLRRSGARAEIARAAHGNVLVAAAHDFHLGLVRRAPRERRALAAAAHAHRGELDNAFGKREKTRHVVAKGLAPVCAIQCRNHHHFTHVGPRFGALCEVGEELALVDADALVRGDQRIGVGQPGQRMRHHHLPVVRVYEPRLVGYRRVAVVLDVLDQQAVALRDGIPSYAPQQFAGLAAHHRSANEFDVARVALLERVLPSIRRGGWQRWRWRWRRGRK